MEFNIQNRGVWTDLPGSGQGKIAGFCEQGNEYSGHELQGIFLLVSNQNLLDGGGQLNFSSHFIISKNCDVITIEIRCTYFNVVHFDMYIFRS